MSYKKKKNSPIYPTDFFDKPSKKEETTQEKHKKRSVPLHILNMHAGIRKKGCKTFDYSIMICLFVGVCLADVDGSLQSFYYV